MSFAKPSRLQINTLWNNKQINLNEFYCVNRIYTYMDININIIEYLPHIDSKHQRQQVNIQKIVYNLINKPFIDK